MGILLKLILFVVVIGWIFRGVARLFLGRLYKQAQEQQQFSGRQQRASKKPTDGNVNIEYEPSKKSPKSSDDFKGGDYVDYEEVKD